MSAFLKQVAEHYYADGESHRLCFVFPNKRSIAFFKKYLSGQAKASGKASMAPRMTTISEFFYILTGKTLTDRIQLLMVLYEAYKDLNPEAESFDDFIYWGEVILNDFGDADKYLADTDHLFQNIAELKAMQDDFSYLSEDQRKAIAHFLSLFDRDIEKDGKYKKVFRKIWDLLLPLYKNFNASLRQQGLSYDGMVYRELASDPNPIVDRLNAKFPNTEKFIFTGLNALNACERKVLTKLRNAGLAEFCWDFSSEEIRDPQNKSSHFLKDFVNEYPQAFKFDPEGLKKPQLHTISVPSSVGQAKLLPGIIKKLGDKVGIETAIVLPDEGLLLPVLSSIPKQVTEINVTMGYPMQGSEFLALMNDIASLQVNLREREDGVYFYHRQVWGIFSNGIFGRIISEEEKNAVAGIRKQARYFISQKDLAAGDVMKLIFRKAEDIASYQRDLIIGIAPLLKGSLEQEFAMTWFKTLTRLQSLKLDIRPATWYKLLLQLSVGESVAFKGEPLSGLQVMGPLETRALDFKNLIILSCNEGIFPRQNVAASFIPSEIRKGFDLPTYEHQDAVWAYYFYRLIQRAENVWMVYDSRTEMALSGEESRYIKQLEMLYGLKPERFVMKAEGERVESGQDIPKTQAHVDAMHAKDFHLSATALQNYLTCPAKFYYKSIEKLGSPDEVAESLDAGMLGTVLHACMKDLYAVPNGEITAIYLKKLLADKDKIQALVDGHIREEMGIDEISGKNLIYREVVSSYIRQILSSDLKQLSGKKSFRCLGLEEFMHKKICGFDFVGYIDRIDSFDEGSVRIIDYKTGKVTNADININADNAQAVVDALFGTDNAKRPKIALQLYLYDIFMKGDARIKGKKVYNGIYQTTQLFVDEPMTAEQCPEFCNLMESKLEETLKQLDTPGGFWERKGDETSCSWCDFKTLCGK